MFIHHYEQMDCWPSPRFVAAFHISAQREHEIRSWCRQAYGEPGFDVNNHFTRWEDSIKMGEIAFAHREDLTLFLLRWA